MIIDKERRRIANELREAASAKGKRSGSMEMMLSKLLGIAKQDRGVFGQKVYVAATWRDVYRKLAELIEPQPIVGNTSDGYHTFNELYHHRAVLFSVIVAKFADRAWKSKLHADGTMYEGMFIVGIETPDGHATYHYDVEPYWAMFRCKEVDRAPEWDGHTPDQAIERIGKLVGLIDRPTCRNIYAETEKVGACENGFKCSECGNTVEDCEGYRISGEFNFCSKCGAEVVSDDD